METTLSLPCIGYTLMDLLFYLLENILRYERVDNKVVYPDNNQDHIKIKGKLDVNFGCLQMTFTMSPKRACDNCLRKVTALFSP